MDEVIFEEFKGTGNSEIILDRKLTDKRLFPTIDITRSGTRKEELLVDKATLSKMWVLRRVLMQMGMTDGMEFLLEKLKQNPGFYPGFTFNYCIYGLSKAANKKVLNTNRMTVLSGITGLELHRKPH